MIIDGQEYAFKALWKSDEGWKLTKQYYFNQAEVMRFLEGYESIWPVEVLEGEIVNVLKDEELG